MSIKLYWTILTVTTLLRNKGFAMDWFFQRTNAILSSSTTLECISSPMTNEVTISDPLGNKVVSCPFDECFCKEPKYSCTKNMPASSTSINISDLAKTDSGLWTCSHETASTVPSSVYEDKVVADFVPSETPNTMTAKVECAYPAANIEWEFVNAEDNSSASTVSPTIKGCVDNGVSGEPCTDAAAKTFTCFFDVSISTASSLSPGAYRVKASLVLEGEVNSTGLFTLLSTVIIVPGPPPNYDEPPDVGTVNIAIVAIVLPAREIIVLTTFLYVNILHSIRFDLRISAFVLGVMSFGTTAIWWIWFLIRNHNQDTHKGSGCAVIRDSLDDIAVAPHPSGEITICRHSPRDNTSSKSSSSRGAYPNQVLLPTYRDKICPSNESDIYPRGSSSYDDIPEGRVLPPNTNATLET